MRHPSVSPETETKLLAILAHVKAEPRRMNMGDWRRTIGNSRFTSRFPPCGTICCIAGWAGALAGKPGYYYHREGLEALGLNYATADALFYTSNWPDQFDLRTLTPGTPEYVAAVERRVLHFIATGE